ncbi:DUF488 domain-containing protein [uncultured Lactobacillus sp.]|uniref:DUF488 domain-containing protein n=1 Tax=uncultured Lactobacillus sp. TaxID=153152 RepID=UPI00262430A1|nr:DUF488 family protein [uncultured Lactobacillus sp.]
MPEIEVVRIYDHNQPDGYRILVDRLWPRGMSKVRAHLDKWDKEIGPSTDLRKWFNHEDDKYPTFKEKYFKELDKNSYTKEFITDVKNHLTNENVLFLYGAKNKKCNQAVALKEYVLNHLN